MGKGSAERNDAPAGCQGPRHRSSVRPGLHGRCHVVTRRRTIAIKELQRAAALARETFDIVVTTPYKRCVAVPGAAVRGEARCGDGTWGWRWPDGESGCRPLNSPNLNFANGRTHGHPTDPLVAVRRARHRVLLLGL